MTKLETHYQEGVALPVITTTVGEIAQHWPMVKATYALEDEPDHTTVRIDGYPEDLVFTESVLDPWNWLVTVVRHGHGDSPLERVRLDGRLEISDPTTDDVMALLPDLDTLVDFINGYDNILAEANVDNLPTWGPEPEDKSEIYSWDRACVMYLEEGWASVEPRWPLEYPEADNMKDDELMGLVRSLDAAGKVDAARWALGLISSDALREAYELRK